MQKTLKKTISIVLVLTMLFSAGSLNVSAKQSTWKRIGSGALGTLIYTVLFALNDIFPDGEDFVAKEDFVNEDFYSGTGEFLDKPAKNACWKLGYANTSLVPDDWQEHKYYLGGYIMFENFFTNKVEQVIDDMKARVIAIEDGSGRGISVFATVDCIGITNADIKEIRRQLVEKSGGKYDFASINVASTHAHSGIDTEGLWTNLFVKVLGNIPRSLLGLGGLKQGTDPHYMEFLYDQISNAMLKACGSMEEGKMTVSRKDIGTDYYTNKNRVSASALMTDMTVLKFLPFRKSATPTMIVNVAAHPDVAGLPTTDGQGNGREISGEYIYYMGEVLAEAGFNCMFFNGAIAGIYMARGASNDGQSFEHRAGQSARYGRELGKMALAANMTLDEIKQNKVLYDEEEIARETAIAEENGSEYTLWCEGWTPVKETEVEPFFNIMIKEVFIPVTNPFIQLAGKLNLANYNVIVTGKNTYEICVELGYVEFGNQVKAVMMPGEVCQDLIVGGTSLTADDSFSGKAFKYPCVTEIFGDDSIICFGLMNDAIGYVIPDNDYTMAGAFDHYHELISLGIKAASSMMQVFEEMAAEVK